MHARTVDPAPDAAPNVGVAGAAPPKGCVGSGGTRVGVSDGRRDGRDSSAV